MSDPRTKRALESAIAALQLAIDAREMTMHQFQRQYLNGMPRSIRWGITWQLKKALGKVKRAMKYEERK